MVEAIRDWAIIILAGESIIIGVFLAVLAWQLSRLVKLLREEIKPVLDSVNETTSTVRGTTAFVSNTVVKPVIEVASYLSAIRRVWQLISPLRHRSKSAGGRPSAG